MKAGIDKGDIGNAVGDEIDLLRQDIIDFLQEFHAALTHHHHPIRQGRHFL
jgi:hypothetical protein